MCLDRCKSHYCGQKNRKKKLALLCLTSGLRPNPANSNYMYFDSIRCYASYAPVRRVTDAINTGVFLGKCVRAVAKTMVVDGKKQKALAVLCLA